MRNNYLNMAFIALLSFASHHAIAFENDDTVYSNWKIECKKLYLDSLLWVECLHKAQDAKGVAACLKAKSSIVRNMCLGRLIVIPSHLRANYYRADNNQDSKAISEAIESIISWIDQPTITPCLLSEVLLTGSNDKWAFDQLKIIGMPDKYRTEFDKSLSSNMNISMMELNEKRPEFLRPIVEWCRQKERISIDFSMFKHTQLPIALIPLIRNNSILSYNSIHLNDDNVENQKVELIKVASGACDAYFELTQGKESISISDDPDLFNAFIIIGGFEMDVNSAIMEVKEYSQLFQSYCKNLSFANKKGGIARNTFHENYIIIQKWIANNLKYFYYHAADEAFRLDVDACRNRMSTRLYRKHAPWGHLDGPGSPATK